MPGKVLALVSPRSMGLPSELGQDIMGGAVREVHFRDKVRTWNVRQMALARRRCRSQGVFEHQGEIGKTIGRFCSLEGYVPHVFSKVQPEIDSKSVMN